MEIEKIVFTNFRNYHGKHVFVLNKNITILYGDNGNGKSSFFDGLEWCLTGTVSRFSDRKIPKEAIANKNIEYLQECSVEIHFSSHCIRRSFFRNESGFGNVEFALLKSIENDNFEKLTSGEENVDAFLRELVKKDNIKYMDIKYKMGEMINKAYILSQDQIADFVMREKASERYNALASIMGFERILKFRKNLTMSQKCLENVQDTLNKEKTEILEKITELKSSLIEVDYSAIEKFKVENNLQDLNMSDINNRINNLQKTLFEIEQQSNEITNLSQHEINTLKEVEQNISVNRKKILEVEDTLEEYLLRENSLENEIPKINELIEKLTTNKKVNEELNLITETINALKNKLDISNSNSVTFDLLVDNKNQIYRNLRLIEFARNNKSTYYELANFLKDYQNIVDNKHNILDNKIKYLRTLEARKNALQGELTSREYNSNLSSLMNAIEKIYDHVKQNNQNDVCPVCSSKVENDLQSIISTKLDSLVDEMGILKEEVARKLYEIEKIEIEEVECKNILQDLEMEIKTIQTKKKVSSETYDYIIGNELFSDYVHLTDEELINKEYNFNQQLVTVNANLDDFTNLKRLEEKLNNLHIDINLINYDLDSMVIRLNNLRSELLGLRNKSNITKNKVSELNNEFYTLQNLQNYLQSLFEKYSANSLSEVDLMLKKQVGNINEMMDLLKSFLPVIERKSYNSRIFDEIEKMETKNQILDDKLLKITEKYNILSGLILKLDDEYGKEATDFLNNENSTIQTYYRYLNPSPSRFNNLYFDVVNNEELYIKIKEDIKNDDEDMSYLADANLILSSGQLNVLALSVFIATNEAQNCSYFDFIAIDDPIQNMDDVNRFSICDVLSQLNRQLIFSTHDQEFLNLFLKKNEHQIGEITLYQLNAEDNQYLPLSLSY